MEKNKNQKEKILGTIARQISVEEKKGKVIELSTLSNAIESKISQLKVEQDHVQKLINKDEKSLEKHIDVALDEATNKYEKENAELIKMKKNMEAEIKNIKEKYNNKLSDIEVKEQECVKEQERILNSINDYITKKEEALNKRTSRILRKKEKERFTKDLEEDIRLANKTLGMKMELATNAVSKLYEDKDKIKEEMNQKLKEQKLDIENTDKKKSNRYELFINQKLLFNSINQNTDIKVLTFFNIDSLQKILSLKRSISFNENRKNEISTELDNAQNQLNDLLKQIDILNEEINFAFDERKKIKDKINGKAELAEEKVKKTTSSIATNAKKVVKFGKIACDIAKNKYFDKDKTSDKQQDNVDNDMNNSDLLKDLFLNLSNLDSDVKYDSSKQTNNYVDEDELEKKVSSIIKNIFGKK